MLRDSTAFLLTIEMGRKHKGMIWGAHLLPDDAVERGEEIYDRDELNCTEWSEHNDQLDYTQIERIWFRFWKVCLRAKEQMEQIVTKNSWGKAIRSINSSDAKIAGLERQYEGEVGVFWHGFRLNRHKLMNSKCLVVLPSRFYIFWPLISGFFHSLADHRSFDNMSRTTSLKDVYNILIQMFYLDQNFHSDSNHRSLSQKRY